MALRITIRTAITNEVSRRARLPDQTSDVEYRAYLYAYTAARRAGEADHTGTGKCPTLWRLAPIVK